MSHDYEALTSGVGFALLKTATLLEIRGSDRATFLHNLSSNDIRGLKTGQGCEAFLLNVQGKILAFVNCYCEEDAIILTSAPNQAEAILGQLDRYLIREDVQLVDRSGQWAELVVAGESAAGMLEQLTGLAPPSETLSHVKATIGGHDTTLCRTAMVGQNSFSLRCSRDDAEDVQNALATAGGAVCDETTVNAVRIEAGYPLYGYDITDANLPQEVDRDATAISFVKGCYLGQETVARIDALGHVNKILRGVRLAGETIPAAGTTLQHEGTDVGQIMSAVFSPRLNAPLALAYVRRGHESPGTRLTTADGEAEVVARPL